MLLFIFACGINLDTNEVKIGILNENSDILSDIENDTISENEIEDMINNRYIEWVESWLDYYVEEVKDNE